MTTLRLSLAAVLLAACGGGSKPATTELAPVAEAPAPAPPAPPSPPPAVMQAPPPAHVNPLLTMSPLYEHAPQFDKIQEDDFMPAYTEGMKQHAGWP